MISSRSRPVVLVGGFATVAWALGPLARSLTERRYDVTPVVLGAGMGCGARAVDELVETITAVHERTGERVRLVGHSRGGQFARVAGARVPERVAALVTVGSPFDTSGLDPVMAVSAWGVALAGSLGVPGLFTVGCLAGACCRGFRAALRAPWPADVPFVSISSSGDRVVPQRSSRDPYARNVEIDGSHLDLLWSPRAADVVAEALVGAAEGADRPSSYDGGEVLATIGGETLP